MLVDILMVLAGVCWINYLFKFKPGPKLQGQRGGICGKLLLRLNLQPRRLDSEWECALLYSYLSDDTQKYARKVS